MWFSKYISIKEQSHVWCPQDRVVAVQMQIHHYTKGLHRESSCSEVGGKERRNSEGKLGRIRRKGDSEDLVGRMRITMRNDNEDN